MAKDYIDIIGTPQQQGPIQPDYGKQQEGQGDEQGKRLADATERMANASEKQQQINVNVLLDPAKVGSQADVPKLSSDQWSQVLGRPVHHGSLSTEGGKFVGARKYYWETQGSKKREEFEETVIGEASDRVAAYRERMIEEQASLMAAMEESQNRRDKEQERKKAIDDSWQLDDTDRRHRRRVSKFESQFSGLEAEAGGRLTSETPPPPTPPVEVTAGGTPQERGDGSNAIAGLLAGTRLGALGRLGLAGGALYAGARTASWLMQPELGGWWQGAVTQQREEATEGAKQEAIANRMKEQAQFAELKGFQVLGQDPLAFARDRMLGGDRANWNRGMFFSGSDRWRLSRMEELEAGTEDENEKQRIRDAREKLVKRRTFDVPQFWSGYREEQEKSRAKRGLMARPVDPEAGRDYKGIDPAIDSEMFVTPDEVGAFGALSILPGTLRSAGMNPYLPGEMDKKYQAYHRQPRNNAHAKDHFSRDERGMSPSRDDYVDAGLAAPMNYARDTEDDLRAWEKSADNMHEFIKQPEDVRQVFFGNYQFPIQP